MPFNETTTNELSHFLTPMDSNNMANRNERHSIINSREQFVVLVKKIKSFDELVQWETCPPWFFECRLVFQKILCDNFAKINSH